MSVTCVTCVEDADEEHSDRNASTSANSLGSAGPCEWNRGETTHELRGEDIFTFILKSLCDKSTNNDNYPRYTGCEERGSRGRQSCLSEEDRRVLEISRHVSKI